MTQPVRASWGRAVADLRQLPPDRGAEVVFVGRSNAGKSSAINAITACKGLAFASKRPGRTRSINFFEWGPNRRLVDLPGYGYAALPTHAAEVWAGLINPYLRHRASLQGVVLVMDARHPFAVGDLMLLEWVDPLRKPLLVLLTKCDKLQRHHALRVLASGQALLARQYPKWNIQLFSAVSGTGVATARSVILGWLGPGKKIPRLKGSKTGGKRLNKD
jgi:GTP-binding protein